MKKIFLVILVALCAASCVKQEDIVFHGIDKVNIVTDSSITVDLNIENKSGNNLKLKELNMKLMLNNKDFLKLVLKEDLTLKRKSNSQLNANFGYKIHNPLMLISFMTGTKSYSKLLETMVVTGNIKAKAGLMTKDFEFEDISILQLLNSVGIDINELLKSMKL